MSFEEVDFGVRGSVWDKNEATERDLVRSIGDRTVWSARCQSVNLGVIASVIVT
jgi:hypothetical protein